MAKGWTPVKLGAVAINSTAATKDYESDGYTRYIIGKHIPEGGRVTTWNPVGDAEFGSRIRTMVQAGDVICTTRGPKLKVAVADFDCLSAHTNFILRPKDAATFLPGLLEAVVRSDGFQDHLRKHFRGSTNLFVNWSDAAQYELALPPLEEQRRIASLLSQSGAVLDALRDAASAARRLYASALSHFFVRNDHGPGIAPVAWATAGWSIKRLEDVTAPEAPISYGIVQPGISTPGGVPTSTSNNLNIGFSTGIHLTAPKIEAAYARSRIQGGDVLVTVKGFGTGNIGRVPPDFSGNITRDVARIRLLCREDASYLMHLWKCHAFERYWRAVSVGTTRPELSIGKLRDMEIPWPPEATRNLIVERLNTLEGAVISHEDRLRRALLMHSNLLEAALAPSDARGALSHTARI